MRVKADAVGEDLYDTGRREFLNYGHTLAHAIERVEDFGWRHGEAVAVGLVFAAELAGRAGLLPRAAVDRHRDLVAAMGLPTSYAGDWAQLQAVMRVDKKARGASLRFVVLDGHRQPDDPDRPRPGLARRRLGRRERRSSRMTIQVLNGANLGRLGLREPETYGTTTYAELVDAARGHRPRARPRRAGAPDRRRGRDAPLGARRRRRRRRRGDQPRRLVAHLGRAPGRPRPAERPAGRGAHHQHPRARGVPAPLLRLRRGRRRHRRPRRAAATCWRSAGWRSGASSEPDGATRRDALRAGRAAEPAGWTPSSSPTCSTSGT